MKINGNQLDSWIKSNGIGALLFALVYGPDEGGIDINAARIAKEFAKSSNSEISKIDFKEIKDDLSALSTKLNSVSLFGDGTILIIENCPQTLPKQMLEFLQKSSFSGKLILKAGELRPTSNLRKLAENSEKALSIACYKDDQRQIEIYVRTFLQERGARFDAAVTSILSQVLPANKLVIASELEKLITYKAGEQITVSDVQDVISDSQEAALDDLCLYFALGQKPQILKVLQRAINTDTSFMLILRVLQRYLSRVLEVLAHKESGLSIDSAVLKLAPPVFFKQKDNLIRVCKVLNQQKVLAMMQDLVKLEFECKRLPVDQYMLISKYLTLGEK
ncbi:MAG: polymerase subunit delta [Candidatus Midichloriaceae bacterium]|jgi:DNA polymerase-3 subunit delta|nr:polymerase subunit delta [Candidatus Midichloriaceae bacterium]